jgi:hypothetical protein
MLHRIASVEAPPLRHFEETIPQELEHICLKALSISLLTRYATAGDFAADLKSWLDEVRKDELAERRGFSIRATLGKLGCVVTIAFSLAFALLATYPPTRGRIAEIAQSSIGRSGDQNASVSGRVDTASDPVDSVVAEPPTKGTSQPNEMRGNIEGEILLGASRNRATSDLPQPREITLWQGGEQIDCDVEIRRDGTFTIRAVPAGTYTIRAMGSFAGRAASSRDESPMVFKFKNPANTESGFRLRIYHSD